MLLDTILPIDTSQLFLYNIYMFKDNNIDWHYVVNRSYVPYCEHPVRLSNGQYVPCGHCYLCSDNLKKEWLTRLNCEERYHAHKCFLTLTFDEDNVDINSGYRSIQLFLKRFRKIIKTKIKYFGSFERGEKTGRAHYHLLIFGWAPCLQNELKNKDYDYINRWLAEIWSYGIVTCFKFVSAQIGYVAGYVQKKRFDFKQFSPFDSRRAYNHYNKWCNSDEQAGFKRGSFYFCSNGFGLKFLLQNAKKIIKNKVVKLAGECYKLPRYFVKKIKEIYDLDLFAVDPFDPSEHQVNKLQDIVNTMRRPFLYNSDQFACVDDYVVDELIKYQIDCNQIQSRISQTKLAFFQKI